MPLPRLLAAGRRNCCCRWTGVPTSVGDRSVKHAQIRTCALISKRKRTFEVRNEKIKLKKKKNISFFCFVFRRENCAIKKKAAAEAAEAAEV